MGGVVKSRGGGGGGEVMGWGGYLRPQPSSSVDVGSKASLAARSAQRKGMFCRKRKIEETGLFGGERGGWGEGGEGGCCSRFQKCSACSLDQADSSEGVKEIVNLTNEQRMEGRKRRREGRENCGGG